MIKGHWFEIGKQRIKFNVKFTTILQQTGGLSVISADKKIDYSQIVQANYVWT